MKLNKKIITVMSVVCSLFLVTVIYLTYFMLFEAKEISNSTYNQRIWAKEEKVLRGNIFDRNGVVLAESEQTEGRQKRKYPFGKLYAHTIGYNNRTYGKTNLELNFNDYLLKTESVIDVLKRDDSDKSLDKGANLELTFEHEMTKLASSLMEGSNGSVVAINPKTGEVYCMYSNPTFDPNEENLLKNWDELSAREDSAFVSRATQGRYAPGSTFKIVTAATAIESGFGNFSLTDSGSVKIGGHIFNNAGKKSYGNITMHEAIKYSSNVFFTSISQEFSKKSFEYMAKEFHITKKIPFDLDVKWSELDFDAMDNVEIASTAIGQGKLQLTPLNMALVSCAVANNGSIMKPYIVNRAYHEKGNTIYKAKPSVLSSPIKMNTAQQIKEYMISCVKGGTGTRAQVGGITVAGKTGTAENEKKGKTHAWFIGFAPAENPQIAICVMKEYSGSGGGSVCAPIASKIISHAYKTGLISAN
ncbi:MAG: peptidoglycan glycosyltransferase [Clostridia bacterium]|nr:peptidoglycan glycosyltransferase [Clostridia bacterium]